jgi:hypothetical protein
MSTYAARESWLYRGVEIFRPRFTEIGFPLPEKVRVAVGFGPTGARQENATILGVTISRQHVQDSVNEIWISPEDADTANMLETLLHELIHAALNNEDGHRGRFAEAATRLGFLGPMVSTPSSVELAAELITIAESLGEYPGAQVDLTKIFNEITVGPDGNALPVKPSSSGPPRQTNRHVKLVCVAPGCDCGGYTVRTSRSWIKIGAPSCPFGSVMIQV